MTTAALWTGMPAMLNERPTATVAAGGHRWPVLGRTPTKARETVGRRKREMRQQLEVAGIAADPVLLDPWRCPVGWTVRQLGLTNSGGAGGQGPVVVSPATMMKTLRTEILPP